MHAIGRFSSHQGKITCYIYTKHLYNASSRYLLSALAYKMLNVIMNNYITSVDKVQ